MPAQGDPEVVARNGQIDRLWKLAWPAKKRADKQPPSGTGFLTFTGRPNK
jgi:hypothetical protein